MEQQSLSKELAPREDTIAKRSKPTLMTMDGGQQLSSDGKWHPDLAENYILTRGRVRWIPTGELAKVFYHANMLRNKERVRRRVPALARRLILRDELLVKEIDATTRRVLAVKLYDARSEQDRQVIHADLQRMRHRRELNDTLFCHALALVERKEAEANDHTTTAG